MSVQPAMGLTHGLVGHSPQIAALRRQIEKSARNRLPVMLLGETGSGKEVVARAIFDANPRGQFVPIDCGSLVGTLTESELFGHVKGAFTGAADHKKGLVEIADGGTAFFDEIGDLPLDLQVKLLRLIQESEYRPLGGLKWRKVDLRVICATHRDLQAEVAAGRFREDLYFRLNVMKLRLPPLREHKQDIPLLVDHFLEQGSLSGLALFDMSREVMDGFMSYDWPGNVRELKHAVERMAAMHSEGAIQLSDFPTALQNHMTSASLPNLLEAVSESVVDEEIYLPPRSPVFSIPQSERQAIANALEATKGEKGKAAKLLGIGRTTLFRKLRKYGME